MLVFAGVREMSKGVKDWRDESSTIFFVFKLLLFVFLSLECTILFLEIFFVKCSHNWFLWKSISIFFYFASSENYDVNKTFDGTLLKLWIDLSG